jgi:methionine-rich copper-binding protein CopC
MIRMKLVYFSRLTITLYSGFILLGLWYGTMWAHTLPVRSEPGAGATLSAPPACIRIWFDGVLDPAFSTITVQNAKGQKVDKGDFRVNQADPTLLEVSLPSLPSGTYRVIWTAVARDGHRTTGDYIFRIK